MVANVSVLQFIRFKVIPHAEDRGSIPGRSRPKSLKQLVAAVIATRSANGACVLVSRVLGDDHYERMPRVTVCVAR